MAVLYADYRTFTRAIRVYALRWFPANGSICEVFAWKHRIESSEYALHVGHQGSSVLALREEPDRMPSIIATKGSGLDVEGAENTFPPREPERVTNQASSRQPATEA